LILRAAVQSHADEKEVAAKAVLGSLDPKGATGHLIFILTMVLELGNFLNAGTRWANAGVPPARTQGDPHPRPASRPPRRHKRSP
jgi:hypothetical protein